MADFPNTLYQKFPICIFGMIRINPDIELVKDFVLYKQEAFPLSFCHDTDNLGLWINKTLCIIWTRNLPFVFFAIYE